MKYELRQITGHGNAAKIEVLAHADKTRPLFQILGCMASPVLEVGRFFCFEIIDAVDGSIYYRLRGDA